MTKNFAVGLEKDVATFEARVHANPDRLCGWDWWQLSCEEEAVFAIDRERWPRMATVHNWYEGFMLIASAGEWTEQQLHQARTAHPDLAQLPDQEASFVAFCRAFGGLTEREAVVAYRKIFFWTLRAGHIRFPGESS